VKIHAVPSVDRASGSGFDFFDTEGRLIQLYTPRNHESRQAAARADGVAARGLQCCPLERLPWDKL